MRSSPATLLEPEKRRATLARILTAASNWFPTLREVSRNWCALSTSAAAHYLPNQSVRDATIAEPSLTNSVMGPESASVATLVIKLQRVTSAGSSGKSTES
jgi:hypothetical protein